MPLETLLFPIWTYIFRKKKKKNFHCYVSFTSEVKKFTTFNPGPFDGILQIPNQFHPKRSSVATYKSQHFWGGSTSKVPVPPRRFRSPPSANRRSSVSTSLAAKWGSWESLALETVFKGITGDVEMIGQQPSCYMQNCYNHQSTPWKTNITMEKQLFEDPFPIKNGYGFTPPKLPPHHRPRYGVATIEAPTIPLVARHSARDEDHYLENPQGTMTCHDRRRNPCVILLG